MINVKTLFKRLSKRAFWISTIIISSAGTSQAMAIVEPNFGEEIWKDVRRELGRDSAPVEMSESLVRLLGKLRTNSEYRSILTLSYSIVKKSEIRALDDFWVRYMIARQDNTGFTTMMRVRTEVLGSQGMQRQDYLEDWLYLARNGNYDCGGGGGGNCGVGVGNGGGDGTTNEGGGNGDDPNGDGDNGSGNDTRPGNI